MERQKKVKDEVEAARIEVKTPRERRSARAVAGAVEEKNTSERLEKIEGEVDRLTKENAALRKEIEQLKSAII